MNISESKPISPKFCLIGANTNGAGFSESSRGQEQFNRELFSADRIRMWAKENPSISDHFYTFDNVFDLGNLDLKFKNPADQITELKLKLKDALNASQIPLILGGDHLVKYAGIAACFEHLKSKLSNVGSFGVLYFDAHPDTLPHSEIRYDSILHHVTKNLGVSPSNVCVVGLRSATEGEIKSLLTCGVSYVKASAFRNWDLAMGQVTTSLQKVEKLYISFDPDVLHVSEAPAVEAPSPGGLWYNDCVELFRVLSSQKQFVGFDISEHTPHFDQHSVTAATLWCLLREFHASVLTKSQAY